MESTCNANLLPMPTPSVREVTIIYYRLNVYSQWREQSSDISTQMLQLVHHQMPVLIKRSSRYVNVLFIRIHSCVTSFCLNF